MEELRLGRPTVGRCQALEAIQRSSAGWWYREGVPERNGSDIECVFEAGHSVLNLDKRQLMVNSVLGISRTGEDDGREIYVYKAEVYLVPHGEVMDFATLQKCRPIQVLFEGRNTGVPILFSVYKSCCIVLNAF